MQLVPAPEARTRGCEAETNQIMLGSDCLSKGKEATKADGLIPSQHLENLRGLALF